MNRAERRQLAKIADPEARAAVFAVAWRLNIPIVQAAKVAALIVPEPREHRGPWLDQDQVEAVCTLTEGEIARLAFKVAVTPGTASRQPRRPWPAVSKFLDLPPVRETAQAARHSEAVARPLTIEDAEDFFALAVVRLLARPTDQPSRAPNSQ